MTETESTENDGGTVGESAAMDTESKPEPTETEEKEKMPPARVLRFALIIGKRAIEYGSIGMVVEDFLKNIVKDMGYEADFMALNTQLVAVMTIPHDDEDPYSTLPLVTSVKAPGGMDLHKSTHLNDLAKDVVNGKVTLEEAVLEKLPAIEQKKDPYSPLFELIFGYVFAGAGLPVVLGGSGWDCLVGATGAVLCWGVLMISSRFSKYFGTWTMAICAFLPGILAAGVKIHQPVVNIAIATLSAVAIPLPGYGVSLGLAELAHLRILRGSVHLFNGLITLCWLVLGAWLGVLFVELFTPIPPTPAPEPVPQVWQWLAIPMLSLCLPVAFQVAPRDLFWSFAATAISYALEYAASFFGTSNVGIFFSAAVSTGLANIWARYFDRPTPILLIPIIVLLVSGSIGFRGLATIIEGNKHLGGEQFLDMIIVALLITVGVYVGDSVIRPATTL